MPLFRVNSDEDMAPPPPIADPLRMELTMEEGETAWTIRRAIEADPEIDNLSDYMYCQLAIVLGDDIQGAVDRVKHLQTFREQFGILNTEEDGRRCIKKMVDLTPEWFMALEFRNDCYSLFYNMKGFWVEGLDDPEKRKTWIVGYYYLRHSLCVDFETIRQGVYAHIECAGYDNRYNLKCFGLTRQAWNAFMKHYPFRLAVKWYHVGVFFNVINAMGRKLYRSVLVDDFVNNTAPPLDEIYLQPTVKVANMRLLMSLENSMSRRFQIEKEFSLEAWSSSYQQEDDDDGSYRSR